MKRVPPQDFDAARDRPDPRTVDDILAPAAAAVINALADRWTSWRRELGFEEERE